MDDVALHFMGANGKSEMRFDVLPHISFPTKKMFENNLHTYTTTINALVASTLQSVCCSFEPTLTYIHHGVVGGRHRPMCCSNRPLACRQQQHQHICILAEYTLYITTFLPYTALFFRQIRPFLP